MQDLNPAQLTTVVGGTTTKNDQITQQITALQSSLKDAIGASTNNNGGNGQMFMMIAMMMAMRPGPTVVAGGPPPVAAAPGSVVNIRTRVGHI